MSEPIGMLDHNGAAGGPNALAISRDLTARTARVAQLLADVVAAVTTRRVLITGEALGSAADAEIGDPQAGAAIPVEAAEVTFLRDWSASALAASGDWPDAPIPDTPWDRLASLLNLSEVERLLILLAGLPEEHEGLASTLRAFHPQAQPHPTVGLAANLVTALVPDRAALRRLLAAGTAVRRGVLLLESGPPFFEQSLMLPDGLWSTLHGNDHWPPGTEPVPLPERPAGLGGWLEQPAVRRALAALRSLQPRTISLPAADEAVGLGRCAALATASGRRLLPARLIGATPATQDFCLQARLLGAVPVLLPTPPTEPTGAPLALGVSPPGPVIVVSPPGAFSLPTGTALVQVPLGPLSYGDHRAAWAAVVPEEDGLAKTLATRHPVDPSFAATVGLDLQSNLTLGQAPPITDSDVSAAIRVRAATGLPCGVELVKAAVAWDRLVVSTDAAGQLHDAVTRWDYQSQVLEDWQMRQEARATSGVRLLLTGAPGTGKSMAAEVLATALGTDLLVVDISRIVSKWIGETEKNLERVFDVAERTQAVLMLDEADALFGTRTEISDAHDRYANLETAYLLQRLDHFDGIAVLATNLKHNIDPAFLRRMDFVIEFDLPDVPSRRALWGLHIPAKLRGADLDLDELAWRYPVPGGWIRNAAIAAAFLAVPTGGPVTRDHVLSALQREYAKAAMPFPGVAETRPVPDGAALRAIELAVRTQVQLKENS